MYCYRILPVSFNLPSLYVISLLISLSYGSSDSKFREEFPEAERGIKALLLAISEKRKRRGDLTPRQSKNGTPEEREQRRLAALE